MIKVNLISAKNDLLIYEMSCVSLIVAQSKKLEQVYKRKLKEGGKQHTTMRNHQFTKISKKERKRNN